MKIALCSNDPELQHLCRDLLEQLAEHPCELSTFQLGEQPGEADLNIWDVDRGNRRIGAVDGSPLRNLFLVHQKDLADFRASAGAGAANILLKPVAHAVLRAYLTLAITAREERDSTVASLARRPGRDFSMSHPDEPQATGVRSGPDELPGESDARFPGASNRSQRLLRACF